MLTDRSSSIYEKVGDAIGMGTYGEVYKGIDKLQQSRLRTLRENGDDHTQLQSPEVRSS